MKRALLVGVDDYDNFNSLSGCVRDVNRLSPLLARHESGSPNFDCRTLTTAANRVTRGTFLGALDELLAPGADVALLYFAGHGKPVANDVVLVTQDGGDADPGVSLAELLGKVQHSNVPEIILVLDCCFGGSAGGVPQLGSSTSSLKAGVSILTASRGDQTATDSGAFSAYLKGALEGGAADVQGKITLAGLYAYISESFGPWEQRPVFKANVDRLHELRACHPAVPPEELRRLPEFFPSADSEMQLDPTYEPDAQPSHPEHEAIFRILQRYRDAKLLKPMGEDHLYYAAVNFKSCRLLALGKHYWFLAKQNLL